MCPNFGLVLYFHIDILLCKPVQVVYKKSGGWQAVTGNSTHNSAALFLSFRKMSEWRQVHEKPLIMDQLQLTASYRRSIKSQRSWRVQQIHQKKLSEMDATRVVQWWNTLWAPELGSQIHRIRSRFYLPAQTSGHITAIGLKVKKETLWWFMQWHWSGCVFPNTVLNWMCTR